MRYSEALEIVHSLAAQNQIDENDVEFGDEGLSAQRAWQQEAIDTLGDLVTNQSDEVDTRFAAVPLIDVAADDVVADRSSDASRPQAAIRVCLDLAEQNVLDDPDMQEEVDRQELAIKTVENFVVAHGDALDAAMTTLKM